MKAGEEIELDVHDDKDNRVFLSTLFIFFSIIPTTYIDLIEQKSSIYALYNSWMTASIVN